MSVIDHNCKDELREVALKATPVRVAILKMLEQASSPMDVSSMKDYLDKHSISADEATVFRIINKFTNKGLTKPIRFNEDKTRYELASKPEHHHLICLKCGSISDISDCNISLLEQEIEKKKKFKVTSHALEFFGICSVCQH